MFWHGSSFGYSITYYINLSICKAIITGACKLMFNLNAGFSATDFVDDLMFTAYAILLTQYGFYLWTEVQVSRERYSHDESLLKYKLSEQYTVYRDVFIKKLLRRFFIFVAMTYWASAWCYAITQTALKDAVNVSGNMLDHYSMGFAMFTCFVLWTHTMWITQMRDWNRVLIIFVVIIVLSFPLVIFLGSKFKLMG